MFLVPWWWMRSWYLMTHLPSPKGKESIHGIGHGNGIKNSLIFATQRCPGDQPMSFIQKFCFSFVQRIFVTETSSALTLLLVAMMTSSGTNS